MARARITIGGTPGSNDDVAINVALQFDNDGNGGEVSYLWSLEEQPPPTGSPDALTSTTIHNPQCTPTKEGTYVLRLVVNQGLPSESADQVIFAVRHLLTRDRVPGTGETTENSDWSEGPAPTAAQPGSGVNDWLRLLNQLAGVPGQFVAQLGFAAAVGDVVRMSSGVKKLAGLPGEFYLPIATKALATQGYIVTDALAVVVGGVTPGSLGNGDLAIVRRFGVIIGGVVNGASPPQTVYVNDLGRLSTLPGTNQRVMGKAILQVTPGDPGAYLIEVDGEIGTVDQPGGTLGFSLLGTGLSSSFGIPQTKTTITAAASYVMTADDRLVIQTGAGTTAVKLDATPPPTGFAKVVRIVNSGSATSVLVKDPASALLYTVPGFAGAYVDLKTTDGTTWTVMYPSLANPSLFDVTDTPGDLATRGASKWGRFSAGAEGFSLLTSGGFPAWDIPLTYLTVAIATGTISASTRLVIYAGGADAILTMPSTAPPSPFARLVEIVNTTSHVVTVKDPGGAIIGILDGQVVNSATFGTPDGTLWGVLPDRQFLPYDQYSDAGLFVLAATTSVGDVVRVDNLTGGNPRITRAVATAISVQTNPLYLVLRTQDGSAAAVDVLAYVIKRGLVANYNLGGSSIAGGDPVYVTDAGGLSKVHGTFTRRVGTVLSGSGSSWNIWFDGTAPFVWQTLAIIDDPTAGVDANVTVDATATPRTDYYMGPSAADRLFDPTTATISHRCTLTKTNTNTKKLTLPATVGWKFYPTGATNTLFDLPGSNLNSDSAYHQWTFTIDVPNKIVYVSPSA